MKKIKILGIIIFSIFLLSNNVISETIIDVDIEPDEPEPASQITITADISSENDIDEVYIEIQECKEDLCFQKENVSMNLINGIYRTSYKLTRTTATYFKYSFSIKYENGEWYETEKTNVTLKLDSGNGSTNGGDGQNKTIPGFELIILILAASISIFLLRRKRLR